MKKIIFIGIFAITISCSNFNKFDPPSWIIGEWSDTSNQVVSVFNDNNIIFSLEGLLKIDFAEAYFDTIENDVEESKNDTSYELSIKTETEAIQQNFSLFFEKISSDQLYFMGRGLINTGVKQIILYQVVLPKLE